MTDDSRKFTEQLYRENSQWLKSRANSILHDSDLSEDIMHDCFIKAIRRIELIEHLEENRRRKYLAVTVDNLAKNYALRIQNKYILLENISDEISESEKSAEDIAESKFQLEAVMKTLEALNEHDREIIVMKYFLHMPDREIAPALNIKENSVRMTVRRSVFNLKKKLGIVKKYETMT